jgi:hypothetical protein
MKNIVLAYRFLYALYSIEDTRAPYLTQRLLVEFL